MNDQNKRQIHMNWKIDNFIEYLINKNINYF